MNIDFFLRTFRFVKNYSKHPIYLCAYGYYLFQGSFIAGTKFLNQEEFVREIKKGRSFLRLNEGEMHLINGGKIHYQIYEKNLEKSFRELIRNYSDNAPYIIGLAKVYVNETNAQAKIDPKKGIAHLYTWMPIKVMFRIAFPKKAKYGDAHAFYYDNFFQENLEEYLLDKHLVVISNEDNINSFKNNKNIPFTTVSFVETPKENSYSSYKKIMSDIEDVLAFIPKSEIPVLLVSTGPTSKQIVYEFAKKGQQSLDIGRGLDFLYSGESIEYRI
jgi:hypothetical protein